MSLLNNRRWYASRSVGVSAGLSASRYDGAEDELTISGGLTNVSDTKILSFSLWVQPAVLPSSSTRLFNIGQKVIGFFNTNGTLRVRGKNGAGTLILDVTSSSVMAQDGDWHHVALSIDLADPAKEDLYIDGVEDTSANWGTPTLDGLFDHNVAVNAYLLSSGGSLWYQGGAAEFYYNTDAFLDLANNLTKFRDTDGRPVYLGDKGELPTGSQPQIMLAAADTNNAGNNADPALTGTLDSPYPVWFAPGDGVYVTGSIYSGSKAITTTWQTEALASGVNAVEITASTIAVSIGWGDTEAAAKSEQQLVAINQIARMKISGSYVAWKVAAGTGTMNLEQSVIKW